MDQNLDKKFDQFIGRTAKSKVAVIVPLYGLWNDIQDNPVNGEVLAMTLDRLHSSVHQLYVIFVAHPETLPHDRTDPSSVYNILMAWTKRGNTKSVPVARNATYCEYITEGMDVALQDTDASFIVVFNPWTIIQHGALDEVIDRSNYSDDAKVISGYDLRSVIEPENLDNYKINMPKEEWDLHFNFLAMPRFIAEMVKLDVEYKTHVFLERDLWEQVAHLGFIVISSQKVLVFPCDFPWSDYESKADFEADRQRFGKKWQYDAGLVYSDPAGASRKDKTGVSQIQS